MKNIIYRCTDPGVQTSLDFHVSSDQTGPAIVIHSFVRGVQSSRFTLELLPEDAAAFRLLADLIDSAHRATEKGNAIAAAYEGDSDA